jgi:hypothetical protein
MCIIFFGFKTPDPCCFLHNRFIDENHSLCDENPLIYEVDMTVILVISVDFLHYFLWQ